MLLVIWMHLGHPPTTLHVVLMGQRRSWQEGTRTQRGHPLRTLQPMPTMHWRWWQEGRDTHAG